MENLEWKKHPDNPVLEAEEEGGWEAHNISLIKKAAAGGEEFVETKIEKFKDKSGQEITKTIITRHNRPICASFLVILWRCCMADPLSCGQVSTSSVSLFAIGFCPCLSLTAS